jgi:hypothetical protein
MSRVPYFRISDARFGFYFLHRFRTINRGDASPQKFDPKICTADCKRKRRSECSER